MPYGRRIDWPGAMHHVMSRGIDGLKILEDRHSKLKMMSLLDRYFPESGARVHAWALMNNHFHLLIETGEVPLSSVMHRFLTAFSVWFNLRIERVGRVFQGRYRSILIDSEEYYFTLVAYINGNPLRAGYVRSQEELANYPYCGHAYLDGSREKYRWEFDTSSSEDYSGNYKEGILVLQKKIACSISTEEIGSGSRLLSFAGMEEKVAAPSERSQAWTGRTFILGNSSYIKDVLSRETDRRLLPVRNRGSQHKMALAALEAVSRKFNVSVNSITGRSSREPVIHARSLVIQYLILNCGFNFSDVARLLNRSRQIIRYTFNKQTSTEMLKMMQGNE